MLVALNEVPEITYDKLKEGIPDFDAIIGQYTEIQQHMHKITNVEDCMSPKSVRADTLEDDEYGHWFSTFLYYWGWYRYTLERDGVPHHAAEWRVLRDLSSLGNFHKKIVDPVLPDYISPPVHVLSYTEFVYALFGYMYFHIRSMKGTKRFDECPQHLQVFNEINRRIGAPDV